MRGNEPYGLRKLRTRRRSCLGLSQLVPFLGSLHPRPGQLADHDRQLGDLEFVSHILNQIHKVLFVLGDGILGIDPIFQPWYQTNPASSNPEPS